MRLIHLAVMLGLIWLDLAALTLLARRYVPDHAVARALSWLLLALVAFCLEHAIGFGRLDGLVLPLAAGSAWLLWRAVRERGLPEGYWRGEAIFAVAFLYGFAWRFAFPSLYPTSEHITDLYFISNYMSGDTLPPLDRWYPPHRFDFYYAFQHYAAALLGRTFGLDAGTTYQVAFALLTGGTVALACELARSLVPGRAARAVLIVAFVSGGVGYSPIMHFLVASPATMSEQQIVDDVNDRMAGNARFIGGYDGKVNTDLGRALFPKSVAPAGTKDPWEPRELPLENFGYQYYVGDYHPPVGGYFLLALTLAVMAALEGGRLAGLGQAVLGLTVPCMLIVNTWIFPLQGILLAGWWAFRARQERWRDLAFMAAGAAAGFALAWPFLSRFALHALDTPIKPVGPLDHTPFTRFLGLHWPVLLLACVGLLQPTRRRLSVAIALTVLLLLGATELVYVDDPSDGRYERTNSVMKWWGYVFDIGLLGVGALCLGSASAWARRTAILAMLLTSVYAYDVARYFWWTGKGDLGHLAGHRWYTNDRNHAAMIEFLRAAPDGIVLENSYENAYSNTTMHALFADKPALLGWPLHLVTWHGDSPDVWALTDRIREFYAGKLSGAGRWLRSHDVRYVVWAAADNAKDPDAYGRIDADIAADYAWREFYAADKYKVGVWVRRP
jgi:Uncharacterized membrane protein (DUF2298)